MNEVEPFLDFSEFKSRGQNTVKIPYFDQKGLAFFR